MSTHVDDYTWNGSDLIDLDQPVYSIRIERPGREAEYDFHTFMTHIEAVMRVEQMAKLVHGWLEQRSIDEYHCSWSDQYGTEHSAVLKVRCI